MNHRRKTKKDADCKHGVCFHSACCGIVCRFFLGDFLTERLSLSAARVEAPIQAGALSPSHATACSTSSFRCRRRNPRPLPWRYSALDGERPPYRLGVKLSRGPQDTLKGHFNAFLSRISVNRVTTFWLCSSCDLRILRSVMSIVTRPMSMMIKSIHTIVVYLLELGCMK